ncbi:unnamed protein product, partial [Adineta steineri]
MNTKFHEPNAALSKTIVTTKATPSDGICSRQRMSGDFLVIWIDAGIDRSKEDCQNILQQLRNVVSDVNIFTERDECIDFLTEVDDTKTFLIVENTIGKQIVPMIHDISQLCAIYVYCGNKTRHEQWAKLWPKVNGVYTEITFICESLQQTMKRCNQDSIAMSLVRISEGTSIQNLDQLEPAFMYTQLLKEILLGMQYDQRSVKDFVAYCRNGDYGAP